jgi:hypothetical protein
MNKQTLKIRLSLFLNILLLAGCLFFAYLWIDRSITLSYVDQPLSLAIQDERLLRSLLKMVSYGFSKEQIIVILKEEYNSRPNDKIVMQIGDDSIYYDGFEFIFKDDKLVDIE